MGYQAEAATAVGNKFNIFYSYWCACFPSVASVLWWKERIDFNMIPINFYPMYQNIKANEVLIVICYLIS
jgi:hypothetical protein